MSLALPWGALRVICEGTSIIDTPALELRTEAEAHQFVLSYGLDLHSASHVEQVWKIYSDACDFIERRLCTPDKKQFPGVLRDRSVVGDFKKVLLIASRQEVQSDLPVQTYQPWFCAILRVMHTMSHLKNDLRLKYLKRIREQTLSRIEAHIQTVDGKQFLGFERDKVAIVGFTKKESKDRHSILTKLLHKPQNVAQEIYDFIGVRFITATRLDALKVIKYLVEHHLVSVANIMPSRCRNTLIDIDRVKASIEKGDEAGIEDQSTFPSIGSENPFSSDSYRAIQFTSRPLIRIPVLRKGNVKGEMAFFFPMEVQIVDENSNKVNESGEAEHKEYKRKQLDGVRSRIMKGLVEA